MDGRMVDGWMMDAWCVPGTPTLQIRLPQQKQYEVKNG